MADCCQLILLTAKFESQEDFATVASMLKACRKEDWYPYPVYSSLSKQAIEITTSVLATEQFDCKFDRDWDPMRSAEATRKYSILSSPSLQKISEKAGANYEYFDFDTYCDEQTEEQFEARIRRQIFEVQFENKIVVAPEDCLRKCLAIFEFDLEIAPVFSLWKIFKDHQVQQCGMLQTISALHDFLSDYNCLADVKLLEAEEQIQPVIRQEEEKKVEVSLPIRAPTQPAAPVRDEEFERLCAENLTRLKEIGGQEAHSRPDSSQQLLLTLVQTVVDLDNRFREAEERTKEEKKELEGQITSLNAKFENLRQDFDRRLAQALEPAAKAEIEPMAKPSEIPDESHQAGLSDPVFLAPGVKEAEKKPDLAFPEYQLQAYDPNPLQPPEESKDQRGIPDPLQPPASQISAEPDLPNAPQTLVAASENPPEVHDGPQLNIISVQWTEKGRSISIVNSGDGECPGYIAIVSSDQNALWSPPLTFSIGQGEYDIGEWTDVVAGINIIVACGLDCQILSNQYLLTVLETANQALEKFTSSSNGMKIGRNQEIEERIKKESGKEGLQMYFKLASEWSNYTEERLQDFILALSHADLLHEDAAKKELRAGGFSF